MNQKMILSFVAIMLGMPCAVARGVRGGQSGVQLLSMFNNASSALNRNLNRGTGTANQTVASGTNTLMKLFAGGTQAYAGAQQAAFGVVQKGISILNQAQNDFAEHRQKVDAALVKYSSKLTKSFGLLEELYSDEEDEERDTKSQAAKMKKLLGYASGYEEESKKFFSVLSDFFTTMGGHLGDGSVVEVAPIKSFDKYSFEQLKEEGFASMFESLAEGLQEALGQLHGLLEGALEQKALDTSGMSTQDKVIAHAKRAATEKLKLSQALEPYSQGRNQVLGAYASIASLTEKVMHAPLFAFLKASHAQMRKRLPKYLKTLRIGKVSMLKFFTQKHGKKSLLEVLRETKEISKYKGASERRKQMNALIGVCRRLSKSKKMYEDGLKRVNGSMEWYLGTTASTVAPPDDIMNDDPLTEVLRRDDLEALLQERRTAYKDAFDAYDSEVKKLSVPLAGVKPVEYVRQFVRARTDVYPKLTKALMRAQNDLLLVTSKITYGVTYPFITAEIEATNSEMYGLMNEVFEVAASEMSAAVFSDDMGYESDDEYMSDSEDDEMASEDESNKDSEEEEGATYPTGRVERQVLYNKLRRAFWSARRNLFILCDGAIGRQSAKKKKKQKEKQYDPTAESYVELRDGVQSGVAALTDFASGVVGRYPVAGKIDAYLAYKDPLLANIKALHKVCMDRLSGKTAVKKEAPAVEQEEEPVIEVSAPPIEKDDSAEKLAALEEAASAMPSEEDDEDETKDVIADESSDNEEEVVADESKDAEEPEADEPGGDEDLF